ncbi:Wzz/FepE/Etk N-terminal domain-containing protein [Actinomadura sp. WAC 06369]|uniref:Wzz/FepE/Etk N-terminal domain-containing protein n=1 Tax=Actinomadura sp. WAC 06369 TaxID=2203193 RepID=UPI000F79D94C|nr:Wzz/FepE/Etk N-terminal domain-containing protein [Actinomadura sp. WAC 06369]RSN68939.1 lipopolysaccharide biosynthesis protein [Actinomadura sp. WAC 06369]
MSKGDGVEQPARRTGTPAALVRGVRRRAAALLRRYAVPIAFGLVGLLGGTAYTLFTPPTYTATAFVLVVEDGDRQTGGGAVGFAQAYGRLAPLPETLAWSRRPLPKAPPGEVHEHIQASTSPDTPLVKLTGRAATARDAAAFANSAADALVRYGRAHSADTGVRVALMGVAQPPDAPTSPNPPLNIAVGTASGTLLAGLAAAALSGSNRRRGRYGAAPARRRVPEVPAPAAEPVEVR